MGSPYRHKLEVEMKPIGEVSPWALNPRDNDAAAERLAYTISAHGWTNPILLDRSGQIIAGHTRLKAALRLGLTEVPTIALDVEGPEAAAIAIADNRLGEFADWDEGALSALLQELDDEGLDLEAVGYGDEDLAAMLQSLDTGDKPDAPEPEEPPEEPESRCGEVYELGPHRLICGDSTDPKVLAELMRGDRADLVWTDPPYGVANVGGAKDPRSQGYRSGDRLENDDLAEHELLAFLNAALGQALEHTEPGGAWYVAGPCIGEAGAAFVACLHSLGVYRHALVWLKDTMVVGRCDYHYQHEPIFYGWKPGAAHKWRGDRKQTTVIECPRPKRNTEHPTMKPVRLVETCLRNHIDIGEVVLDPFGGSGSTLLASARLGCHARLAELDPGYCDVIRRRWTAWADEAGVDAGPGALR